MARLVGFAGGAAINVELDAAAGDPTFVGPLIGDLRLLEDVAMVPRDFSGLFTAGSALTFTAQGALPTGLSLSSAGVLSGTPTTNEVLTSIEIRASDGSLTADSNSFSISILDSLGGGVVTLRRRRR